MNKAFEKIVEKLEELQNYACFPTEWVNEEQSKIHSYYADKLTEILKLTKQYNNDWIPCSESFPGNDGHILLSFENVSIPLVGRYEEDEQGGAFYVGEDDESCISSGIIVNAWMPLPETYKEEKNE